VLIGVKLRQSARGPVLESRGHAGVHLPRGTPVRSPGIQTAAPAEDPDLRPDSTGPRPSSRPLLHCRLSDTHPYSADTYAWPTEIRSRPEDTARTPEIQPAAPKTPASVYGTPAPAPGTPAPARSPVLESVGTPAAAPAASGQPRRGQHAVLTEATSTCSSTATTARKPIVKMLGENVIYNANRTFRI